VVVERGGGGGRRRNHDHDGGQAPSWLTIDIMVEERSIPENMSLCFTIVFLVDCHVVNFAEQKRKVSGKKKNGKRTETGNWKAEPGKYSRIGWRESR
jgi:hypothetical protein